MANEVRELAALLYQVRLRQAGDLLIKVGHAEQFGQHPARVVKAERLVEVGGEQEMLGGINGAGRHGGLRKCQAGSEVQSEGNRDQCHSKLI